MKRITLLPFLAIVIFISCTAKKKRRTADKMPQLLFAYTDIAGIGHEEGCTRRDPSDIILVRDTHYVYYTKVYGRAAGYWGTIWCARSKDGGHKWEEIGEVLGRGTYRAFDSQATFTPNIIRVEDKYCLFYTGVRPTPGRDDGKFENNDSTDFTAIGLALSDHPEGPFIRAGNNPVLEVSIKDKDFDSYRVDDASLILRKGKFHLYYKGRSRIHGRSGPTKTQMGVAFSNSIEGPYKKHGEPILPESHEVLIWPYRNGVASLASFSSTFEFAQDGVDFLTDRRSVLVANRPNAPGAFRPDLTQLPLCENGLEWGISMVHNGDEAYLIRFDCNNE